MARILIVDHGDASTLAAVRERYTDAEVITPEEAKERNIVIDSTRMNDIPIINHRDIPILKETYTPRKANYQPWKRRGKNTKNLIKI